jgi:hypothetical protein
MHSIFFAEVRMKKAASITIIFLLASVASAQNWFKGSLDEVLAKAKSENKRILLDFTSYT